MSTQFVKIPATVTLPDGSVIGDSSFHPAKVFVFGSGIVEVYLQDGRGADVKRVYQGRLTAPYSGTFDASAATFQTEDGELHAVNGPGCGCGMAIKTFTTQDPLTLDASV